jgi:hypothetical protein
MKQRMIEMLVLSAFPLQSPIAHIANAMETNPPCTEET